MIKIFITDGLPWILSAMTIFSMWQAGNKNKIGWAVSIGNQALWGVYIVYVAAWGLIPYEYSNVVYIH